MRKPLIGQGKDSEALSTERDSTRTRPDLGQRDVYSCPFILKKTLQERDKRSVPSSFVMVKIKEAVI